MQIAILGTGKMARGIGYALRDTAHDLTFGSRDAHRAEGLAQAMSEEHGRRYRGTTNEAAAARADLSFLCVPWAGALELVRSLRASLDGRVLVDLALPLDEAFKNLVTDEKTSGAEEVAVAAGPLVRVVAALQSTFAGTFAEPAFSAGLAPDVFIAGDDEAAKQTVAQLVQAMGFGAVDTGPLRNARTLERMSLLLIELATRNHWSWNAGFKILH